MHFLFYVTTFFLSKFSLHYYKFLQFSIFALPKGGTNVNKSCVVPRKLTDGLVFF